MFSNYGYLHDSNVGASVTMSTRSNGKLSKYVVRGSSQDYYSNKFRKSESYLKQIIISLKGGKK